MRTRSRPAADSSSKGVASRARTTTTSRSPRVTGFPALAFYLALIALVISSVLREARRSRDRSTRMLLLMLAAALAGHLVTDAFMTADLVASWLQWILMGAGLAVAADLVGLRTDA